MSFWMLTLLVNAAIGEALDQLLIYFLNILIFILPLCNNLFYDYSYFCLSGDYIRWENVIQSERGWNWVNHNLNI